MKTWIAWILTVLLLTGCGKEQDVQELCFLYNGISISMGMEAGPVLYRLGEPVSCTLTPSCAFEGMDAVYYHGSFYIATYPRGDREYIQRLWFADDTVATREGIHIGSSRQEVELTYADGVWQEDSCTVSREASALIITVTEGTVSSVEYALTRYAPDSQGSG